MDHYHWAYLRRKTLLTLTVYFAIESFIQPGLRSYMTQSADKVEVSPPTCWQQENLRRAVGPLSPTAPCLLLRRSHYRVLQTTLHLSLSHLPSTDTSDSFSERRWPDYVGWTRLAEQNLLKCKKVWLTFDQKREQNTVCVWCVSGVFVWGPWRE